MFRLVQTRFSGSLAVAWQVTAVHRVTILHSHVASRLNKHSCWSGRWGMHHGLLKSCSLSISSPDLKWLDWNELHLRLAMCCLTYACRHDSAKANKVAMKHQPLPITSVGTNSKVTVNMYICFKQENSPAYHFSSILHSLRSSIDTAAICQACCCCGCAFLRQKKTKKMCSFTSASTHTYRTYTAQRSWHLICSIAQTKSDFSPVTDHLTARSLRQC